jgi:hypothetical protein
MLRFLFHVSVILCSISLLGCSNDSPYTATAVLSLNQADYLAPLIEPPTAVKKAVQLERYAQLAKGYRVLNTVLNEPDILELECVKEAIKTQDLIDWLEERITVEVSPATETLTFDVSSSTPQQAIALCDAVIEAFLEEVVSEERNEFLQTLNTLRALYQQKEEGIRIRREDLQELARTVGSVSAEDASPVQQLLLDQVAGYRREIYRLYLEGANKAANLLFLEREEKQTPDTAEAIKKLKRELAQNKHKIEFFNQQYIALAMQVEEIGEYSADLVRRQDELVHLTQATNELGLLLERMELQARLNLRAVHIDSRPHVPGYDGDD